MNSKHFPTIRMKPLLAKEVNQFIPHTPTHPFLFPPPGSDVSPKRSNLFNDTLKTSASVETSLGHNSYVVRYNDTTSCPITVKTPASFGHAQYDPVPSTFLSLTHHRRHFKRLIYCLSVDLHDPRGAYVKG